MGKTILIVEDEQNIVDILSFNLSREGYDTLRHTTEGPAFSSRWSRIRT